MSGKTIEETYIKEFVPETVTSEIGVDDVKRIQLAENNKSEAARIFNVNEHSTYVSAKANADALKTICSFNIDEDVLMGNWKDYFTSILPIRMIKKNKEYKSNNHLWIPDLVIRTNLDMMNDEYFQSLRSGNEDYNVYSDIIYTVNKQTNFKVLQYFKKINEKEDDW